MLLPLPNGECIAGGLFRIADGAIANNIARWDGVTWHALGAGTVGQVNCLAQLPNGDLVAGGNITSAGGQSIHHVARWDGQAWTPLGAGPGGGVYALRVAANGNLVAGGSFPQAGSPPPNVMQWNGTTWSQLGANPVGTTRALAWLGNGDLVAGGSYTGGPLSEGLMRWNGSSWQSIPGFDTTVGAYVADLATRPNGDLVILGQFQINGVPASLAVWNGTTMQAIAPPATTSSFPTLMVAANGDVLLGGGGTPNLARWNGATWQTIAGGNGTITELGEDAAGNVLVGFASANSLQTPSSVRRFDGTGWQDLGAGRPPIVQAMTKLPNGDVIVGGIFFSFEGTPAYSIARWNGAAWSPLGLGITGTVDALATAPNGDVLVGGHLIGAGGAPAVNIARWDGQNWSTLGAGLPLPMIVSIRAIAVAANGDVIVLANNAVLFRFDGAQWQQVAVPGLFISSTNMVARPNGDLVIAGFFSVTGSSSPIGLMLYSAGTLTPVAGAPSLVTALDLADDGSVLVAGAGTLQRWDGSAWTALPALAANHFAQLPNGELVAAGYPNAVGGAETSCLFRLRASGWESWGNLTAGLANSLVATPRGEVLVGGTFATAGNVVCCDFARSAPTCPATTTVFGSGCSGGAGPVTLSLTNGAWVGGTMRATAHTFPAGSLAVQALGVQNTLQPLPGGAPGCSLFVLPILTDVLVPSGSTAASAFAIPAQPALAGQQFRMQVVGIEFAGTSIVRLTSTNALDVTIGAL